MVVGSLFCPGEGVTLAQIAIESKEERDRVLLRILLESVDLRNKVVIGDALHTQRQVSIQIGKAGGHYLWTVKGYQPQLLQDLQGCGSIPILLLFPGMG